MPGDLYDAALDLSENMDAVDAELEEIAGLVDEIRGLDDIDDDENDGRISEALAEAAERCELLAASFRSISAGEFEPSSPADAGAEIAGDDDEPDQDDTRR